MTHEINAADFLARKKDFFLLDVRTLGEWSAFHESDAVWIPLNELLVRINEVPKGEKIAVVCRSGNRSAFAAMLLREKGFNALNLAGGLRALVLELREKKDLSVEEASKILHAIG